MYRKRWETLEPTEKHNEVLPFSAAREATAVCGTYGISWDNSIKFFTLGSVSRGIPRGEWDISLEGFEADAFAFYPQANILAVAETVEET